MIPTFERFSERARQVIVLAQDEARSLKHDHIGTEHLLAGLVREEEGLAARVLDHLNLTAADVREASERIVGLGTGAPSAPIPFTPRSKKVLELTLRESMSLGHNFIGTEHLLLGLVRENEGVAARILLEHDITPDKVRNEVIRLLSAARPVVPVSTQVAAKRLGTDGLLALVRSALKVDVPPVVGVTIEAGQSDGQPPQLVVRFAVTDVLLHAFGQTGEPR